MSANLRVHVVPVGFEVLRVTEPLIRMRADKAYFVRYRADDPAMRFYARVKNELESRYQHIAIEETFVDIWNLYSCLEAYREIIRQEQGNHVYFNVSTGTKITAMAGLLSCMLWDATPYYAKVAYPQARAQDIPTEQVDEPDILPIYEINKPKEELLLILGILKQNGGRMKKVNLIRKLEEEGIIKVRDESKTDLSRAAKHSQLRAMIEPLESSWRYIKVEASGRRSEVSLTEQGNTALNVFGSPRSDAHSIRS